VSDRVLSTNQALDSITKLHALLNGGLPDQLQRVLHEGQLLSDPNVLDGYVVQQFRSKWDQGSVSLVDAMGYLVELRNQVEKIYESIVRAGGNF
jgi:uncharacterized protein (DUF2236 family)